MPSHFPHGRSRCTWTMSIWTLLVFSYVSYAAPVMSKAETTADVVLQEAGIHGGLIVHLGCGDGRITAALGADDHFLVHGLDTDPDEIRRAREHFHSIGVYGRVAADHWSGDELPYIDNLVNLVVIDEGVEVAMKELMRILAPRGVACAWNGNGWEKTIKPRPDAIDEWTHYLYDASNNAVASDSVVGPPRRFQWVGSPRWSRHHDRMSSVSAVVSAGGRVFYIFDEASRVSALLPPKWKLIARDAFNGTILWKRSISKWHPHLWPLKSGPAQLPRRLVAHGDRVYVTLGLSAEVAVLNAATGETVRTFEGTERTEEILLSDDRLFVLVNQAPEGTEITDWELIKSGYNASLRDDDPREIVGIRADTGEELWRVRQRVLPGTMAADPERVVFHDGKRIRCLDPDSGDEIWHSDEVARAEEIRFFYLPTLVLYKDVVLFSGGETAGLHKGDWYTGGKDTITALSAKTGERLWSAHHPPAGYRSPEDILVVNGLVWTGETTSGKAVGVFTGRDPYTGEVKSEFPPDVDTYWFHHRCYRGKATDKYLLMSRTGIEFIDVQEEHWIPNHWVRGACLYGVMPANGLIYAPQHPCACYLESKLYGFNALAPASDGPRVRRDIMNNDRLEKGPAYGQVTGRQTGDDAWPTYRHDAARSGRASTTVAWPLERAWRTPIGGKLSSPVVAHGKVFVASVDTHTIHALDAESGKPLWQYTAGGRIDSPPTIHEGAVLFGACDGWVYCLRADDGELAWRFLAAPCDERMTFFEQVESVWPVHGSVLVQDGVLYCVAGRSMLLDGGMLLWRLEPRTGGVLSKTVLDGTDPETGRPLESFVSWLNMPTALPDILSSDGDLIFMRSHPFRSDGTILPLKAMPNTGDPNRGAPPADQLREHSHLFSPSGFLDDSWWHRTYWMYGSTFVSGWCGYFTAGQKAPAGRILAFDDDKVYGFGRKPQYYRWTTSIEHHLFAADRLPPASDESGATPEETLIRFEKSKTLNPAGKPITVEAWVRSDRPSGVIVAQGGGGQGYALYLKNGRPHFTIRVDSKAHAVVAKEKVIGRWAHLAGVLTADGQLRIYVDGALAASATTPGTLSRNPQESMQIGADEGSPAAEYTSPFPFAGLIDEVRVYHRALNDAEIKQRAEGDARAPRNLSDCVLACSFDGDDGRDASGFDNHGKVVGAATVSGKIGKAMRFTGKVGKPDPFEVQHDWTLDLPLFARGMVLTDGTLFVAGPPDVIDEEEMLKRMDDAEIVPSLIEQATALKGERGAMLWAVSSTDGEKRAALQLESPPVFDGLIAARRQLYLSAMDGSVSCLRSQ